MVGTPIEVLLVEDDEVDVMAVRRAFRQRRIVNEIVVARDGLEALETLRGRAGAQAGALPFVVLLDLNLPRMNGQEFLHALRADPALHRTIVFVLTSSKAEEDRAAAYAEHVAGYIVKRDVADGFLSAVDLLDVYWRVVELP